MRKLITLTLTACALAVPAATAAPMKGKPTGPKPCRGKAKVMVVLKGTLANDPATGETSFQLSAKHSNRWGRGYVKASETAPVVVNVTDKTRYVKAGGHSTLDALALNDAVVVKSKMSRCDLRDADPAAMPALTAKMVVAKALEATESD
jgi:hypothetical protein